MASIACTEGFTKFFFTHIQKTGGKSMTVSFSRINPFNVARTMHDSARSFKDWWPDEWDQYPSFAIVRNPYSRWVSIYHNYYPTYPTFREFMLDREAWLPDWEVEDQWMMLSDEEGEEIIVDHIGRFETLDESWGDFCRILGVEPFPLDCLNPPKRRPPWREYYDSETKRIAAELSARDLGTFGYRFDP